MCLDAVFSSGLTSQSGTTSPQCQEFPNENGDFSGFMARRIILLEDKCCILAVKRRSQHVMIQHFDILFQLRCAFTKVLLANSVSDIHPSHQGPGTVLHSGRIHFVLNLSPTLLLRYACFAPHKSWHQFAYDHRTGSQCSTVQFRRGRAKWSHFLTFAA